MVNDEFETNNVELLHEIISGQQSLSDSSEDVFCSVWQFLLVLSRGFCCVSALSDISQGHIILPAVAVNAKQHSTMR